MGRAFGKGGFVIKQFVKGKIAVFIDAANILYSQKTLGWRVDYEKLKNYLNNECIINSIYYYTGKVGSLEKQVSFIEKLKSLDFVVVAKEVKFIRVDTNRSLPKANLDVELALDAYRLRGKYETLLLFSGDSDFAYLVELLRKENKKVIVLSTRGHIGRELIQAANKYVDLRKLRKFIEYKKSGAPKRDS